MKKFLLTLSSVFLFAATLSAQITLTADNVMPFSNSVFGTDEMRTIKFDSIYKVLDQRFDSANHNFVSDTFGAFGGAFVFDTSNSIHSNQLFTTNDGSGFVLVDAEAAADTQRVTLTSPAFSTVGFNTIKVTLDHYYKYSLHDSAVNLMVSTNGTTWDLVKSFSADAIDRGSATAFAMDTFSLGNQYLNQSNLSLRLVYASDSGYQWAINDLRVNSDKINFGYSFFRGPVNVSSAGATWDLSNIEYDGGYKYYVRKAAPAPFRFIDSLYNENLLNFQHTTYSQNYFTLSGIIAQAHLTYEQKIPINALTGGVNDTLWIPTQFLCQYSSLHTKAAYPMTYDQPTHQGTKWSSDFTFTSEFRLQGLGVNIAVWSTANRFTHIIQKDTVQSFGKMRVKGVDGVVYNYDDVLLVKTEYTQIDSFHTANAPNEPDKIAAYNTFMGLSGLTNPTTLHYTTFSYLRKHAIQPFVTVYMQDTFVTKIEVNKNTPFPTDVAAVKTATNDVLVYPNPVNGHEVTISIAKPENDIWDCELMNTVGQTIGGQRLTVDRTNGKALFNIPASLSSGLYYLHITKNGETVTVKPLQIQN